MPELPEVQTITLGLDQHIKGFTISQITFDKGYNSRPNNKVFAKTVLGKKVLSVERIAKNIIIKLNGEQNILIHLGMSGKVLLHHKTPVADRWARASLVLKKGKQLTYMNFCDTRKFGKIALISDQEIKKLPSKYGFDPVKNPLSLKEFETLIKKHKTNIKSVLLNQKVISGLGNIYATDALFLSGINPKQHPAKISSLQLEKLLKSAIKVLTEGINHKGSTLSDRAYVDIFGQDGGYQNRFKMYAQEKCPNCKTQVTYIKLSGRGTYFCPVCQPLK
jgi:formamidopyrimidine-DNA glycosylase